VATNPPLRELIPNYLESGMSDEALKTEYKVRLKQLRAKQSIPTAGSTALPPMRERPTVRVPVKPVKDESLRGYIKNSDDTLPSIARGLASNFIRLSEGAQYLTGFKPSERLVNLGNELDKTKERVSSKNISPQRRAEKEQLAKQSANAKGVMENVKTGLESFADTLTHPKEWTVQGATEFAADPTNAISFGVGGLAKNIASPFLRALAGGFLGAGENATLSSAITYAQAKGAGKSDSEAKNMAIQSAAAGGAGGAVLGGAGGLLRLKPHAKETTPQTPAKVKGIDDKVMKNLGEPQTIKDTPNNTVTNVKSIDDVFSNLDLLKKEMVFNIVKAEQDAVKQDAKIKEISHALTQQGVKDPAVINAHINKQIKPTVADELITKAVNNGKPLPPKLSGARILTTLKNTIQRAEYNPKYARTSDDVFGSLISQGADHELATVMTASFEKRDPAIFEAYYGEKLKQAIMQDDTTKTPLPPTGDVKNEPQGDKIWGGDTLPDTSTPQKVVKKTSDTYDESISKDITDVKSPEESKIPPKDSFEMVGDTKDVTRNFENISVEDWVKEAADIQDKDLRANLFILQNKHPEYFKNQADVYKTILEIKNDPTHFYKNNRPDISLIAKRLKDGSIGKMGIVKETNQVAHVNKSKRTNEENRLDRVNKEKLEVGSPYPTLRPSDKLPEQGGGADALSPASEASETIVPKNEADVKSPLHDAGNDITYDEAYSAHRGTSHIPEVRAKQEINSYTDMLKSDYDELLKGVGEDKEKKALLDSRFYDYRQKMKTLKKDLLAKKSRTMSAMITGGSNFPVTANRKKMGYVDNALNRFSDTREKWMKRIKTELNPPPKALDSVLEYKAKLQEQTKKHEMMKKANVIVRSKKIDKQTKIKQLLDLGFKKEDIKAMEPNGFPAFALANSNGRIKHTKQRIAQLQRLEAKEAQGKASTELYEGANIKENIPQKRVQIFFDEIPDSVMRTRLKKKGFKWSPKNKAWQRKLTTQAYQAAKDVMKDYHKRDFDKKTKEMLEC